MRSRRVPLVAVLAVLVALVGYLASSSTPTNPNSLQTGLGVTTNAESTALYCTGLTSGASGRVSFFNTAGDPRTLSVSVVSSSGSRWSGTLELGAHQGQIVVPRTVDPPARVKTKSGHVSTPAVTYATAVQISGGGVVAEQIEGNASVPCVAQGTTRWYAAGFNTLVGSDTYISLYNPTGTEAVANISALETNGFSAPQAIQGVSIPAHAQVEVDLGRSIVNTANVGVDVKVVRGSLAVVGEQVSGGTLSFDQGVGAPSTSSWLPAVTTVANATAEIRVANPNDTVAHVTASVTLGTYRIAPQATTVAPYSSGLITITPNSAIPADGYASVQVRSNVPVVAGLAAGTSSWFTLSSPQGPALVDLVRDYTGQGFDAAEVTNASHHPITVRITTYAASPAEKDATTSGVTLKAFTTVTLASVLGSSLPKPADSYLIVSSKPGAIVTLSLPSSPRGLFLQSPLDGG
jgi:hypothetical protein